MPNLALVVYAKFIQKLYAAFCQLGTTFACPSALRIASKVWVLGKSMRPHDKKCYAGHRTRTQRGRDANARRRPPTTTRRTVTRFMYQAILGKEHIDAAQTNSRYRNSGGARQ